MLSPRHEDPRTNETVIKYLTDDRSQHSVLLGCPACPLYETCGGLAVQESIMDCTELCCGNPARCTTVCPNDALRFVSFSRETLGFDLENAPRAPQIPATLPDAPIPLIYHGGSREKPLTLPLVALRLADLIDFRGKTLRYNTRDALAAAFRLSSTTGIILSGVDHDHRIEPWWRLGDEARASIIAGLPALGIRMVSTPNFSLVLDKPRSDDLHAIKRTAITFAEFQAGGVPCALHVNGRTDHDFDRWSEFIATRPEIQTLAYEFSTGTAQKQRVGFHLKWLAGLALEAGRPLDIIVRGDPSVLPFLRQHFRSVLYLETTAFMKSMQRQKAVRVANDALSWGAAPTRPGENLDALLHHNVDERLAFIAAGYYGSETLKDVA